MSALIKRNLNIHKEDREAVEHIIQEIVENVPYADFIHPEEEEQDVQLDVKPNGKPDIGVGKDSVEGQRLRTIDLHTDMKDEDQELKKVLSGLGG